MTYLFIQGYKKVNFVVILLSVYETQYILSYPAEQTFTTFVFK
jgi:hypothetical protein